MRIKRNRIFITDQLAPLFRRVSRIHNAMLVDLGLRAADLHILATLWDQGPMRVRQLGKELGLKGSTLTGALDRLEQRELLRREPEPADRRAFRLVPAQISKKQHDQLQQALDQAEQECFGGLTREEQVELLRLVSKANRALEQKE